MACAFNTNYNILPPQHTTITYILLNNVMIYGIG